MLNRAHVEYNAQVAKEMMKASHDLHASQLESNDNEIMVSQSLVGMDSIEHTVVI
jgi:hypothetical protein